MGGNQEVVWLLLATVAAFVAGETEMNLYTERPDDCSLREAYKCYLRWVAYGTTDFPFYGKNEAELDGTCEDIGRTYECIKSYIDRCNGTAKCGEQCKRLIGGMITQFKILEFEDFAKDLCDETGEKRGTYLENINCLESNREIYTACHNDSETSKRYLDSIQSMAEKYKSGTCCYFSWYFNCFTKVTLDKCGQSADFFIESALHMLSNQDVVSQCKKTNIKCDAPPLPPEEKREADEFILSSGREVATSGVVLLFNALFLFYFM